MSGVMRCVRSMYVARLSALSYTFHRPRPFAAALAGTSSSATAAASSTPLQSLMGTSFGWTGRGLPLEWRRRAGADLAPAGVRLLRGLLVVFDPGIVPDGGRLDGVARAAPLLAGTDGKDHGDPFAGADDRVRRVRRAVEEVERGQRPLVALDDQQCLALEDEEVLLPGFMVVQRHGTAGLDHVERDPEVVEVRLALTAEAGARPHVVVQPLRVASVDDEPAGRLRDAVLQSCLHGAGVPAW